MECVKAVDYGYRVVVVVCHNPGDAAYLHSDGSTHPVANVNGCKADVGSPNVCTGNHRFEEFIWDGEAQYLDGVRRSSESFWEEICERCASPPAPLGLDGLVGRSS